MLLRSAIFAAALVLYPAAALTASEPLLPRIRLTRVASGLTLPTEIAAPRDGSGRLFVARQHGLISIVRDGEVVSEPFLDIRSKTVGDGESGLIGLAFAPSFAVTGRFYITYVTRAEPQTTIIARYTAPGAGDSADPASEEILLALPHPNHIHFGGTLRFGPDGYLYAGLGDGGSNLDEDDNAQNPMSYFGKLLRIDSESGGAGYSIPPSNPFVNVPGYLPEIWALGLRNPWKFSFDAIYGDLYIGDVGQADREEVDFQSASSRGGENYGWRIFEGNICAWGPCGTAGVTWPVRAYGRDEGGSVTGGYVYRGQGVPGMQGAYIHGDFVTANIWGLYWTGSGWRNEFLLEADYSISAFGQDDYGELYVADYDTGGLYRIDPEE